MYVLTIFVGGCINGCNFLCTIVSCGRSRRLIVPTLTLPLTHNPTTIITPSCPVSACHLLVTPAATLAPTTTSSFILPPMHANPLTPSLARSLNPQLHAILLELPQLHRQLSGEVAGHGQSWSQQATPLLFAPACYHSPYTPLLRAVSSPLQHPRRRETVFQIGTAAGPMRVALLQGRCVEG